MDGEAAVLDFGAGAGKLGQEASGRGFERDLLLARLRSNLTREALERAIPALLRDQIPLTVENLNGALLNAVGRARPRSRIVPWFLADSVVEVAARLVARELIDGRA